jgi:amino acid adenylation domain-containing protein
MSTSDKVLGNLSAEEKRLMLAALLRKRAAAESAGERLSEAQRALWYWQRLHPRSSAYNLVASASLRGDVDVDLLQTAVAAMVARHPQLRSTFPLHEGKPRRRTAKLDDLQITRLDASTWTDEEYRRRWDELSDAAFDLEHDPLLRATILSRGPREHVVHLCVHHIVTDFWSAMQMLYEMGLDYRSAGLGVPSPVTEAAAAYGEFVADEAEMLAGPEGERLRAYWNEQLAGAPTTLTLPFDRRSPTGLSQEGAGCDRTIDAALAAKVRRFAESEGTTPYVVCLAAFCVLLHRWTGQDDLLVGTPYHGRTRAEWQHVVGYFSNTAVVRSRRKEASTFRAFLAEVRATVNEALAHARYPFSRLAEELADRRTTDRPPLVQAALAWEKVQRLRGMQHKRDVGKASVTKVEGIDLELTANLEQRGAPFELILQIHDDGESLDAHWQYARELFDAASIEQLAEQYVELLAAVVDDPNLDPAEQPTASAADRAQLDAWNRTPAAYPQNVCLHDLIAAQAARAPQNAAVRFRDTSWTYAELEQRAARLAGRLQAYGVGADAVVGVYLHRSAEMVCALYGILKSGGAYMPLNPEDPWDRTAFTLQDAGAMVVVTERQFAAEAARAGLPIIVLDDATANEETSACDSPTVTLPNARSLAYVIYTSGSTGKPKGVMNEHRSIVNRLLWMQDEYRLTSADRVLQKTPYTFDVSVWEFFWPLLVGAEIVVAEPGGHRDPAYLVQTIADCGVTTLHFVPTMLRAFLQQPGVERLRGIRQVFASGEALSPDLVTLFHERCGAALHNLYGPTEAAVDVTYFPCLRDDLRAAIPIGRPIANTEILILNRQLQPQPIGMTGELYIGGVGLARGYRNRPDLTAERFIPHPTRPGERLYRTGDVARWTAGGVVEYHGRCDGQVKLGGNRIELGEIEVALTALPSVVHAAVIVREDQPGQKRLVAYVVPAAGASLDADAVRTALAARLPKYMVPTAIVPMESLPQTTSGKVDRNALPEPAADRESTTRTTPYIAPRTTDERALAAIFADVLNLERVGVEDNFFDLGGASSQAVEIIGRAATLGYALSPDLLFRVPTIAGVAEACRLPQPIAGNVVVESLGVYLPPGVLTSEAVMQGCVKKLTLPLGRLTGIKSRRVVGENEFAYDLAAKAVAECLSRTRGGRADVDAVICCNISRYDGPNFTISYEPSTAAKLCAQFGFDDAIAFDVSNACAGMFTGVSLGEGLIKNGIVRRVLVVSGEYISYLSETAQLTIENDFDSRLPCLTLGDAGAAVLLEGSSRKDVGFFELDLCTLAQHSELCIAKATIDGPIMYTDMLGVSQVITQQGIDHWTRTAQRKNWALSDVKHMIPHQVSQTTIVSGFNEMRKRSGIEVPIETVISNVAERGNTATTSHWVAVWDHTHSGRIQSGDNVMFGVSGSGITVGTGLYRFDDLPDRLRTAPSATSQGATPSAPTTSSPRPLRRRRLDPRLTKAVASGLGIARPNATQKTAMDLALAASRAALSESKVAGSDVGLLLYAGVYRDEFLSEPAFAAMLADQLRLHDPAATDHPPFFSFDVLNGSIGFLQACHLAAQRIQAGRIGAALVATAEVEPHAGAPLGLAANGAALVLQAAHDANGGGAGFGDFVFRNDWRHLKARETAVKPKPGTRFDAQMEVLVSPDLGKEYVALLVDAIEELRDLERLAWDDVGCVLPPHLPAESMELLLERLPALREKLVVDDTIIGDLFTAAMPFAWQTARLRGADRPGTVGLLLAVGAGIQAGCATYRFGD